jgi:Rieske Fe-S protein
MTSPSGFHQSGESPTTPDPTTPDLTTPDPTHTDAATSAPSRGRVARVLAPARAESFQSHAEFPYEWREDDLVTRRDTLRFLVAGTGALFVATGALAIIGSLPAGAPGQAVAIAQVGELAPNAWRVFDFPDRFAQGILINLPGKGLVAYSDVCTHLSCAVIYTGDGKHLHCPCHEGLFDAASGAVLAGPPTRPLPLIQLATRDGTIYAVKEIVR